MARYEIGFQTAAPLTVAPYAAFRAPTRTSKIIELGLACNAATASAVALHRNTAAGYAATTSTSVGQADNPLWAAGTSLVDTAWSTPPTITTASKIRAFGLPATVGAGLIWVFQDGLWVRSGTATDNVVIWNFGGSTAGVLNGYIIWEE